MRNSTGELPNRLQFLALCEFLLQLRSFLLGLQAGGDVFDDGDEIPGRTGSGSHQGYG